MAWELDESRCLSRTMAKYRVCKDKPDGEASCTEAREAEAKEEKEAMTLRAALLSSQTHFCLASELQLSSALGIRLVGLPHTCLCISIFPDVYLCHQPQQHETYCSFLT